MPEAADLKSRLIALSQHGSFPGLLLIVCAAIALALDNSRLSWLYDGLLETRGALRIGALEINKPLLLWINDGLMAVFFFLAGLEIKREMQEGALSGIDRALLPAIAAAGGMAAPALIYAWVNAGDAAALRGWAIPSATDIAFSLAVLALAGKSVPVSLRAFLLGLAIIDDIGSIIVIGLFYTSSLSWAALGLAAVCVAVLAALNAMNALRPAAYLLAGLALWACVLKSGVHATLAGVITALAMPAGGGMRSKIEHDLHPWVTFGILPLFAFANSGVSLAGFSASQLLQPVASGVILGLFIGKQIGVFGLAFAAIKSGLCRMPEGANWLQLYGVSALAGIGFTMSLFIGTLAFGDGSQSAAVRLGVITGSLLSAAVGYAALRGGGRKAATPLTN